MKTNYSTGTSTGTSRAREGAPSQRSVLDPREKPDTVDLLEKLTDSLTGAHKLEYFDRMWDSHKYRSAWWENQHRSGRKVVEEGEGNDTVFPWIGASDTRIHLIDEIIGERCDFRAVALKRAEMRLLPSDIVMPDDAATMQRAAAWRLLMEYYLKETERHANKELLRWSDIADEFGHAILQVSWKEKSQLEKRTLAGRDIEKVMLDEALAMATNEVMQDGQEELTEEQAMQIAQVTEDRVAAMLTEPGLLEQLEAMVQDLDPEMPDAEAARLAKSLQNPRVSLDQPIEYYAPTVVSALPHLRALVPFVDVFYPAETSCIEEAEWIAVPEWFTASALREKIATEGWDQKFVNQIIERHSGRSVNVESLAGMGQFQWILSGAAVGLDVVLQDGTETNRDLYQVIHFYYRATSMGNVPAIYRTVLHGEVQDSVALHECCEEAHGEYPFVDLLSEPQAPLLLSSRGVPEISFTYQQEVKTQRDMRADWSSLQIRPPAEVPISHGSRFPDIRPGKMIPRRATGGMGGITFLQVPGNISASMEIEASAKDSIDAYWARGPKVDPDVKVTRRQAMIDEFLGKVKCVRKMMFQLAQQYAPEKIRIGAVGGLAQRLEVSKSEIQGQVSMDLQFDAADLDMALVEKKIRILQELIRPMDTEGNMPVYELLRAATTMLLPSWSRTLLRDPEGAASEEAEEEKKIISSILNGLESPYAPGKNHGLRLRVMQEAMQRPSEDGGPTRVQQILGESPDVQKLWQNRMRFHEFQQAQTQTNPAIGRLGVQPIQG